MPFSDDLYSAWDDDSEGEPIGSGANQPGPQEPETLLQQARQGFQDQGQNASGTGDDDSDDEDFSSPTDGYFGTTSPVSNAPVTATSSNLPRIPNVVVEDPSLQRGSTAESKAREADQERTVPFQASTSSAYRYPGPGPGHRPTRDTYHQPSSSSTYPHTPLTTSSYTSYVPHRSAYDEQSPIIPREAPPAYTPSPTSSSSPPGTFDPSRTYRTFSPATHTPGGTMGHSQEHQGLLARDPESMGNPEDSIDDATSLWRERMKRRLPHLNRRNGKMLLLALVLILVTAGLLTASISAIQNQGSDLPNIPPSKQPVLEDPATGNPPDNNNPPNDNDQPSNSPNPPPTNPNMEYPDMDNELQWDSRRTCRDLQIARSTQAFPVSFEADKNLVIAQTIEEHTPRHEPFNLHVEGTVIFRRTGSDTPGPSVVVESIVNDDRVEISISWDEANQILVVRVPRGIPWNENNSRPCVNIKITVWVPEDASLDQLDTEAVHLDIKLLDNLSIEIAKSTKLEAVVGKVTAASTGSEARDDSIADVGAPDSFRFRSRFIEVETTSGAIQGSWPLYDYLSLQSTSGNVKVGIEPKPADQDEPKPATLSLQSLSGDVEFREPVQVAAEAFAISRMLALSEPGSEAALRAETVLPPRDYRVSAQTTSGKITGSVAFSSTANFQSTSGKINIEVLPVLDSSLAEEGSRDAVLRTSTISGGTDVVVLDPLWIDAAAGRYVDLPPAPRGPQVPIPAPSDPEYIPIGSGDPYAMLPGASSGQPPQARAQQQIVATKRALRSLRGEHDATSANLRVKYPGAWEGQIDMEALSGKLTAGGKDVRIIKSGSEWPGFGKYLHARKGEAGGSKVHVKSTSGDALVWVGE